jgi:hypothetical protein
LDYLPANFPRAAWGDQFASLRLFDRITRLKGIDQNVRIEEEMFHDEQLLPVHFISREGATSLVIIHPLKERVDLATAFVLGGEAFKPVAKELVESALALPGFFTGKFNCFLIRTECDVFHNTNFVQAGFAFMQDFRGRCGRQGGRQERPLSLLPALFLVFFAENGFHGDVEIVEFLFVHRVVRAGFADGFGFAGKGIHGGEGPSIIGYESGRIVGMDAGPGSGGDGVLIGSQKEELPLISIGLVADAVLDVLPGVVTRGVFFAICENGYNDSAGALLLGRGGELGSKFVNAADDGIEQCRGAARHVGFAIQRSCFGERDVVAGDFVLIVKKDKSEPGLAWLGEVLVEEAVEALDGGGRDGCHRAGAIENEEEVGEMWVHKRVC